MYVCKNEFFRIVLLIYSQLCGRAFRSRMEIHSVCSEMVKRSGRLADRSYVKVRGGFQKDHREVEISTELIPAMVQTGLMLMR
jgi:hypothetical protein